MAFLYLAGKLAKYDLQSVTQSKSRSWWRQFVDNLDVHDLDSECKGMCIEGIYVKFLLGVKYMCCYGNRRVPYL